MAKPGSGVSSYLEQRWILDALAERPLTVAELEPLTARRPETIRRHLRALETRGKVRHFDAPEGGRAYLWALDRQSATRGGDDG